MIKSYLKVTMHGNDAIDAIDVIDSGFSVVEAG